MNREKKYLGLYQGFNPSPFGPMDAVALWTSLSLLLSLIWLFLK